MRENAAFILSLELSKIEAKHKKIIMKLYFTRANLYANKNSFHVTIKFWPKNPDSI